jgi:hypothetical protein
MKSLYIVFTALVLFSCQNQQKVDINKAKQAAIDSMKTEIQKQRIIDSMQTEIAKIENKKEIIVENKQSVAPVTTKKKKGWSRAAKGAVIGAGVGAVTGAIISKKKGEGAIIGGLAGAGVGAGTGAILDSSKK